MRSLGTEDMIPEELTLYLACQYTGKATKSDIVALLEHCAELRAERDDIAEENQRAQNNLTEAELQTAQDETRIEELEKQIDELQAKLDAADAVIGATAPV